MFATTPVSTKIPAPIIHPIPKPGNRRGEGSQKEERTDGRRAKRNEKGRRKEKVGKRAAAVVKWK